MTLSQKKQQLLVLKAGQHDRERLRQAHEQEAQKHQATAQQLTLQITIASNTVNQLEQEIDADEKAEAAEVEKEKLEAQAAASPKK